MDALAVKLILIVLGICVCFYLLLKIKRLNETNQLMNQVKSAWHLLDGDNPSDGAATLSLDELLLLGKSLNVIKGLGNKFKMNLKMELALAEKFHHFGDLCLAHNMFEDALFAHQSAYFIRKNTSEIYKNDPHLKLLLVLSHLKISHAFRLSGDLKMADLSNQAAEAIQSRVNG